MADISLTPEDPTWAWTDAETDTEFNFALNVDNGAVNFTDAGSVTANFDGSHPFSVYAENTSLLIGNLNGGAGDEPITLQVGPDSTTGFANFQSQWLDNMTIDFSQAGGTGTVAMNVENITTNPTDVLHIVGVEGGASFTFVGATPDHAELNDGILTFYEADNTPILQVEADNFTQEDVDSLEFNGNNVSFACFLRGTLIATPEGPRCVEDLRPGDQVQTASGGVRTVKWIGRRTLYAAHIPDTHAIRAFPVRIAAGAFAPNIPGRDLYVSPGHHMYFNGKLIPAMLLVNGKTIIQDFSQKVFEYFHLELDQFDILLSEGAASESYVDTGNRSMFQNVNNVTLLADFGPPEGRPAIDGIEVLRSGPEVSAVRKRLLKRAEHLTQSVRVSDPDIRVEVDGQAAVAQTRDSAESVLRFSLPAGAGIGDLQILSRSAIVRETSPYPRRDLRKVGVGLIRITIEDDDGRRDISLSDTQVQGLHAPQDVHGVIMRWTDGHAVIPQTLHRARGNAVLELHVLRTYSYWESAETKLQAA
ncbi:Hint domain-containing protein [Bordetella sp. BOR01]|uniref:Hint domain-containing protein n=1 Tax=Bordetella sp. BOR01 TaxID=2854779 RepID=UPI001C483B73|nr:Hint domain-containing protein [Bordetella sp. BOR01]MBV7482413.1 Hint domain-containing protein [Bordetella sp. BOR01]